MNNWTKHVIMVNGMAAKVYVNASNTQSYVFPLFGKYFGLYADVNVLDFATDFLFNNKVGTVTHANYLNSLEDTAVIDLDTVAA